MSRSTTALRAALASCLLGATTVGLAPAAHADDHADALALALAIATDPDVVVGAEFVMRPDARATMVATEPTAGFPRHGDSFAVLSSGIAEHLYSPSNVFPDTDLGGPSRTGSGSDRDVTILRVDVLVPETANCLLGVDFRFLSVEFPRYLGSGFNDAFIAEVGESTWSTSGSSIVAPDNFAFDPSGAVISINAAGDTSMTAQEAEGTGYRGIRSGSEAYGGATTVLTAAAPLDPGLQSLFFSIFDQADNAWDSAVLIDNLRIGRVADPATQCLPGAQSLPLLEQVTATPPTFTDDHGTAHDVVVIPQTPGVTYLLDGTEVAPGTHPGVGTVTVTAHADHGYELVGASQWTFTFTDIRLVEAVAPLFVDHYGTAEDVVVVPEVEGVRYAIDGVPAEPGTYPGVGTVEVTAAATEGHVLGGADRWTFTFTDIRLVEAVAPTFTDEYGTAHDVVTVPATEGVRYLLAGAPVGAGTYPGAGTVVVTAEAIEGHVLAGADRWTFTFTDIRLVEAAVPTFVDEYGTASDVVVVPATPGVRYLLDGVPVAAGAHPRTGSVVVTAEATEGHVLTGADRWTFTFTDIRLVAAPAPSFVDEYGTSDDVVVIPAVDGVDYLVDGVGVAPGEHHVTGEVVVTAVAQEGHVLDGADRWTFVFTDIRLVTAAAPAFTDEYGTAHDVVTIPATEGVQYLLDGAPVVAGTHPGSGEVVVTAVPRTGYVLDGADRWTFVFTDIRLVTAVAPVFTDEYGTSDDAVVIPATEGVQYLVDGVAVAAGTYHGTGEVVVTAVALTGHVLDGADRWTFVFTDIRLVTAEAPVFTDEYGTADDVVVVPHVEGVRYLVDGEPVAPGTYPAAGTVEVTAEATDGYELAGADRWSFTFTDIRLVTAVAPVFTDEYGTADDVVVVPHVEGVRYLLDGEPVAPGTYPVQGTVVVTAEATPGHELSGALEWSFTFTDIRLVQASAPSFVDAYGTDDDVVVVPEVEGVRYVLDGQLVLPGTYPGSGTVEVVAVAASGYVLDGADRWSFTFTDIRPVTVVEPVGTDRPGTSLDTYTIPDVPGVTYYVDGEPVLPGTYAATGTVVITVVAEDGYDLQGPSEFTLVFSAATAQVEVALADLNVTPSVGGADGSYTIPDVEGATFWVDGVEVPPGTYRGTGTVVVEVRAQEGYVLTGSTTFVLELGTVTAPDAAGTRPATPVADDERAGGTSEARSLARTGSTPGVLVGTAALLLAVGAVLMGIGRRRSA